MGVARLDPDDPYTELLPGGLRVETRPVRVAEHWFALAESTTRNWQVQWQIMRREISSEAWMTLYTYTSFEVACAAWGDTRDAAKTWEEEQTACQVRPASKLQGPIPQGWGRF